MLRKRRRFLKQSFVFVLAPALGGLAPFNARAASSIDLFLPGPLSDALKRLFPGQTITESKQIDLKIPLIAENGAMVPVSVGSSLSTVQSITISVEKNPVPLVAQFDLSPELDALVSTRIKMAETSDVIAVVATDQGLYSARQRVKVTIGGCGG